MEMAVEAATGGAGAGAPTAAEWDDKGELDYTSLGSSPAHLAVPLIPRHAGGVEAAVEAATGGAGAGAPMAAEWDDRGELDYTSLGSSPAQKGVQLRKVHTTLVGHVTIHAHCAPCGASHPEACWRRRRFCGARPSARGAVG